MKHFTLRYFILFWIVFLTAREAPGHENHNPDYVLAVGTQLSAIEEFRNWKPVVELLSKTTGSHIHLRVYETISEYEADVMKGKPDFVFMNPYLLVKTKDLHGYIPLVRDKNLLVGILVVSNEAPIHSVKELDGKDIAFPTPNVFVASLYMRAVLTEKEKISFTPRYVMSHGNVYRNVILGITAAGSGVNKTLNKEKKEIISELRVVYQTPGFAPHPLSAHPRVPSNLRRKVIDTVMKMAQDKNTQELLKKIQMPEPVRASYQEDYSSLKMLNLEKYFVVGSE